VTEWPLVLSCVALGKLVGGSAGGQRRATVAESENGYLAALIMVTLPPSYGLMGVQGTIRQHDARRTAPLSARRPVGRRKTGTEGRDGGDLVGRLNGQAKGHLPAI
jgi:hypothetical protein